ncbi:MAG: hypothetical protein A2Y74_03955 [Actinobacteria bacterium RBG_13_63_9]|nr:MAG: hypothetical protein A2Y74_03955 [Actinobacteria bacterium RBG_13_63_9]
MLKAKEIRRVSSFAAATACNSSLDDTSAFEAEGAHKLFLLRVHRDHRVARPQKRLDLRVDVPDLG